MENFEVTKSWLVKQFEEGALVKTVLEKVNTTLPEGTKLSELKFKAGLKKLGINLRTKPRPSSVMFVDDTVKADVPVENSDNGSEVEDQTQPEVEADSATV